ncbi:lipocalin-like domain-containing protein [Ahrensia sp. R2A130]|uniref:lipocalin-like domain-containing protein n=1 Tax=Ahrensia sp. R2A130 TaxID=744979 RepID=UPI0001E083A3|nr:lipocalin-like domain-containing protein [Ahrensia sp. R2A130]EFL90503.1 secreted hydrolase [Ahrensia sp. R2A130]
MSVRFLAAFALACWLPVAALAQGFGGLGTTSEGYAVPSPDGTISFPADHAAHPDYRIEWWYVTANMTGPDGTPYGLQWTLFRSAFRPDGKPGSQFWMGHAAVTTPDKHFVAERRARGGIGQADVDVEPFNAFIDDWALKADEGRDIDRVSMAASGADFAFYVKLIAQGPLVLQGINGYSRKSESGTASYYYSQPAYALKGTLKLPSGDVAVTGSAWLDREWSSQPLSGGQRGWDWFSLSFEDGHKMMAFQLREAEGKSFTSATWITPQGDPTPIDNGELQLEPLAISDVGGRDVPTSWRLRLPSRDVDVTVEALNTQAWMATSIPYWEGPVTVSGNRKGRGYLEMTGYDRPDG